MTPTVLIALLKRLPGRPLLHCYLLLLLPSLLDGLALLIDSPWVAMVSLACFFSFSLIFTLSFSMKHFVDQRDYALTRAITSGTMLLVYPAGISLFFHPDYLGLEARNWLFITAFVFILAPFVVFRQVQGFHRAASTMPDWNTPSLVNPHAMEGSS